MNRLRLLIVLVAALVLACLAFIFSSNREPRYQGRTLSAWIEDARPQFYAHGSRETNPVWQNSRRAVKQMGPDTIPFLLQWIRAQDSPLKVKVTHWLRQIPFLRFRIADVDQLPKRAMIGFALLEADGKPAWPVLSKWTESPDSNRRFWAFDCLIESKADKETLLPVLQRLGHDPDTLVHDYAARQFRMRYPQEANAAGIAQPLPSAPIFSRSITITTTRSITNPAPTK